jgi:hypothetical protein
MRTDHIARRAGQMSSPSMGRPLHRRAAPSLATRGARNKIYQCDQCLGRTGGGDENGNFVSVLDAIQGDGFNPLWEEQQITFADPTKAHQFLSDNDILAAQATGEITITDTDEMYRCAVLGPKKK